jgi:signal transduction histidine kinase
MGVDFAILVRYDPPDTLEVVGAWTRTGAPAPTPVGGRLPLGGRNVTTAVYQTGRPARIDYGDVSGVIGQVASRGWGLRSSVGVPVSAESRLWGCIVVAFAGQGLLPADTEARLASFTELVATAIANAESRSELAASRRRIVAASDQARRRIERDLHDGTQQRLVSLGLAARTAETDVSAGRDDLRAYLSRIAAGLADAVAELQELSRGIHPAILSERGLGPALRTLARRSAVPVDLDVTTDARFPEPIEIAAYYVASAALANAMKHARASRVEVSVTARHDRLLSIRDDGVGGADPVRGSGLAGLTDRVEALGGSIHLHSPAGAGTHVTVDLPREYELTQGADRRKMRSRCDDVDQCREVPSRQGRLRRECGRPPNTGRRAGPLPASCNSSPTAAVTVDSRAARAYPACVRRLSPVAPARRDVRDRTGRGKNCSPWLERGAAPDSLRGSGNYAERRALPYVYRDYFRPAPSHLRVLQQRRRAAPRASPVRQGRFRPRREGLPLR